MQGERHQKKVKITKKTQFGEVSIASPASEVHSPAQDASARVATESSVVRPFPLNSEEQQHKMVKRGAPHGPRILPNDIYVSRRSNYGSLVRRAKELLERKLYGGQVHLHGLGSAIEMTCTLALEVQMELGGPSRVQFVTRTETVQLVDDFEPTNELAEPVSQIRYNSAIHITLRLLQSDQSINVVKKPGKKQQQQSSSGKHRQKEEEEE